MTHYEQLQNWLETTSFVSDSSIVSLRKILGEVMQNVNNASDIFYQANHNPQQHATNIQKVVIDAINYNKIKELFPKIEEKLSTSQHNNIRPIVNILHTLERSSFTDQQVHQLESLLNSGGSESGSDFPETVNLEGLNQFTKGSIYNLRNESEKTLKALREILQNAVDATDPKQHPELLTRANYKPEIQITTHPYSDNKTTMDVVVHDHGIGMHWDVLSKKFFVTFGSGKKDTPGATGGFGVAKVIIQNAPQDGWSIDTNSLHSNKFQKNVYLGSRKNSGYATPNSKITVDGTTLSLYGVPYAENYYIKNLCATYATNGRVKIILNKEEITPKFTLQDADIVSLQSNINKLPELISSNETEKDIAKSTFNKEFKNNLDDEVQSFASLFSHKGIKVNLYLKKHKDTYTSGSLYIMLNGQYQFHQDKYLNKVDVICAIETSVRPGDEDYPLDPGRDNIRGVFKDKVDKIVSTIKQFTDKVKENDLFKQGLEAIMVNTDADPLSAKTSPEQKSRLSSALHANLESTMQKDPEEQAKNIVKDVENIINQNINPAQEDIAIQRVAEIIRGTDNRIEQKQKIEQVINGLLSPANIMIQKNFVARKAITEDNFDLNADILILWQNAIKILIDKLAESGLSRFEDINKKQFIPGLIYSDECLGLYMPAKREENRPYPSISVNPVSVAAAIHSKYFEDNLSGEHDKEAFSDQVKKKKTSDDLDTPTNNVAKFIFHIAIHELTHLLYPDSWSGNERFHNNVTYLELYCHDSFEKIKKEVKTIMPKLKVSSKQLLSIIVKERKKNPRVKLEHLHYKKGSSFQEWLRKNLH